MTPALRWTGAAWLDVTVKPPPEEAAVAIVIDGSSQAVLMATPHDLDDFATGFALTEGLIQTPDDITDFEVAEVETAGLTAYEARLWLRPGLAAGLADRRRAMVGPVGCGLCGVDSIDAALPAVVPVTSGATFVPSDIDDAMAALSAGQVRWQQTPSIHAACLWTRVGAVVREDVGRHNALDKLAGAVARQGGQAAQGIVAMTSRLSVDLVQKAARMGAPVLAGVGVPTQLAIAWADACGMTLVGRARDGAFDAFAGAKRLQGA
ncbi:MAG: formate dehydrogenase accessory sulfurtransferase FdhD [Paracoccus denitrificans]|nr:MAG: formate dehydrogenase accessory sulfurtransferase FdhD [Paracoccus denitrificans]PZO83739.1 MAG: formate dehydrogenase accessory sulfurtransferase FdhD [Paracoccus denitrificans]